MVAGEDPGLGSLEEPLRRLDPERGGRALARRGGSEGAPRLLASGQRRRQAVLGRGRCRAAGSNPPLGPTAGRSPRRLPGSPGRCLPLRRRPPVPLGRAPRPRRGSQAAAKLSRSAETVSEATSVRAKWCLGVLVAGYL